MGQWKGSRVIFDPSSTCMASASRKNRRKKRSVRVQEETRETDTAVECREAQDRLSPLLVSGPGSTDDMHTPLRHQTGLVEHHNELDIPSTSSTACSAEEHTSSKSKRKKKKKKDSLPQSHDPSWKGPTKPMAHSSSHHQTDPGAHSSSSSAQGREGESSFELELEWCIAQLVIGAQRTDASKGQRQENEKLVRVLRSEKTPLPRKRQLMRSLFGDYRSRMKKEPLPDRLKAPSAPSISSVDVKVSEAKGRFFKKSSQQQGMMRKGESELQLEGVTCSGGTGEGNSAAVSQLVPFCFNFDVESSQ